MTSRIRNWAQTNPSKSLLKSVPRSRRHVGLENSRRTKYINCNKKHGERRLAASVGTDVPEVKEEETISGMKALLDSLKWNADGLVAVIVQNIDTGEACMQAFADRSAVCETMQTGLATFYSRSRKERWCKGETSGNFIKVMGVFPDCDRDSIIYIGDPIGPSCHTGARTCWFTEMRVSNGGANTRPITPQTTLFALENTIETRQAEVASGTGKSSWTGKLLSDEQLLCSKIREEASELCQTLEDDEGKDRAAQEMADLLYHSMVLLRKQGVEIGDVLRILRGRFGVSGLEEKQSRSK